MFYPYRDLSYIFQSIDMYELLLIVARMCHAVQVPRQLVARLHAGVALTGDGGKLLNLCDCCVYPLTERRQRRDVLTVYRSLPLPEQPWIAEAAAAYHRKLTAGVAQDMRRVLGREDIAVCDDRDAHGLAPLADNVPVRFSTVILLRRCPRTCAQSPRR